MKKSLMSNIKNFVDSNVRHRIDKVSHNNEYLTDDLLLVERHFEDLRQVCVDAEKRISSSLQSIQFKSPTSQLGAYAQNVQAGLNSLSHNIAQQSVGSATNTSIPSGNLDQVQQSTGNEFHRANSYRSNESLSSHQINPNSESNDQQNSAQSQGQSVSATDPAATNDHLQLSEDLQTKYKKLPTMAFLRFLTKTGAKLKPDSSLAISLNHCAQLQSQLTRVHLTYEQTIDSLCLKPIQHMLEIDIPNVVKLRKLFIKSHNDLESFRTRYNGASLKQLQHAQQVHSNPKSSNAGLSLSQANAQQLNLNKLDQLRRELDEAETRFEQARVSPEAKNLIRKISLALSRTVIRACERELDNWIIPSIGRRRPSRSPSASASVNTC